MMQQRIEPVDAASVPLASDPDKPAVPALGHALAAEFIGTFALIFIGVGAATSLGTNHDPAVAFAHGLTIMVFATALADISGAHFNPAVSIGAAIAGAFPGRRVASYVVAQLSGGIVAAIALRFALGGPVNKLGATLVNTQLIAYGGAFTFEAVGTCFLVSVVLLTAVRSHTGIAPVVIGMTVTACILGFGVLTGGSVNPARTIAPAVATGSYSEVALYVAAQLVGGIFAGALYRWFWLPVAAKRDPPTSDDTAETGPHFRRRSFVSVIRDST
jgi:MIP family channel proteins